LISHLDIRAARRSEWARFKHGGSMGKLTRDDAYQGPEEVHGVQQPPQRIFTHLFDFEVDQIHPLYGITQTEDMHYLSQWFGPPVQELQESATIEEAIERCQAHYDSLSSEG
jgi:hypothetical protein